MIFFLWNFKILFNFFFLYNALKENNDSFPHKTKVNCEFAPPNEQYTKKNKVIKIQQLVNILTVDLFKNIWYYSYYPIKLFVYFQTICLR
jgi:hypothetical protein